ncbi:MAG: hypothetical protein ACX930_03395 [Erythrobacter sp.]
MSDDQEENEKVTVTIEGNGISFQREIDLNQAGAIISAVLGGFAQPKNPGNVSSAIGDHSNSTLGEETPLSMREFLDELEVTTNAETVVAIAEFHRQSGTTYVSRDDVAQGFADASMPEPSNLPRDIGTARKKGWLAYKAGSKDEFYVTKTGRALLEKRGE